MTIRRAASAALLALLTAGSLVLPAFAQQRPGPAAPPAQPAQQQQAQQQEAQPPAWDSFPTMLLERVYRGPLRDTIIQRWRDPADGTVCFLYIPISAPLLQPQPGSPYVQYGPNMIGSVSCVHPTQVVQIIQPVPQQGPGPAPQPPRPAAPR